MTFDVSFTELWQHICRAGYWMIAIVGVWAVVYAVNALAWQQVIRGVTKGDVKSETNGMTKGEAKGMVNDSENTDETVSFWRIYRLTITGYALNYATPVGGLGGEPYRIMELSRDVGKEHASSSVILYAMMHFVAHFFLWFTSVFLFFALAWMGYAPMSAAVATVLCVILVFCMLAFFVFARGYRRGVAVMLMRWISKIPGLKGWGRRFAEKNQKLLQNIDYQIAALHRKDKRAFYSSFALEYLSRIVQSTEILFMLLLFDVDGSLWMMFLYGILIFAFMSLFANIIGFLPMQLGVQEGGFVLSIAALGLSAALGIFVSIICRVREIIWIFIGIMLMRLPSSK